MTSADTITIYHNPRCSTSRKVLDAIRAAGHEPVVVDYLFKLAICTLMFVPAYGVLLNVLTRRLTALRSGEPQP